MPAFWTWLTGTGLDDPRIQAQIRTTVDHVETTVTQRTVAQIQARLRAAAAEQRLVEYTATLLHSTVDELSADLLRTRRNPR